MSTLTNKLYQSRAVILDMLKNRYFNIDSFENYTRNEIDIMFKNISPKNSIEKSPLDIHTKNNDAHNIIVKYIISSKLRQAILLNLIDEMIETQLNDYDTLILIVKDKINNIESLESYLDAYYEKNKIFIQIFWIDKLQVNITKHNYVPKHQIISEKEKENLLSKYNLNSFTQLPLIASKDPVAKYLGMKKGNVCLIERPSETGGIYQSYRYCQ